MPEPIPRYRAWHEQLKEMRPVRAIYFPTTDDPTGGVELHGHEGKCGFDEVVLMPGAGFATKNGTLFEGDLVHDDRYGMLLRVAYRQDFGWDGYAVGGSQEDMDFLLEEDGSHLEVLGNIYENPELLNPPSD